MIRSSSPHYLQLRNSGYYFRYALPQTLRPLFGWEIKRSLKTRSLALARKRARVFLVSFERLVSTVVQEPDLMKLSRDNIESLLAKWAQEVREEIEETEATLPPMSREAKLDRVRAHEIAFDIPKADYFEHRTEAQARVARLFLDYEGVTYREDSPAFSLFLRRMQEIGLTLNDYQLALMSGAPRPPLGPQSSAPKESAIKQERQAAAKPLSALVEEYLREAEAKGVQPRSLEEYRTSLSSFVELHGDVPCSEVSRASAVETYSNYKRLPPNRNKKKEFKGKSALEIVAMNPPETVSENTIKKFITRVSTFFNWCENSEYISRNPAQNLSERGKKRKSAERSPFTDDQLKKLFHPDVFRPDAFTKAYQYWLPLLGLYTGARITELAQLRPQDITSHNDIPCIHFTPHAGPLKTAASERMTPIHSKLITLGFVDFAKRAKQKGQPRLFPEAKTSSAPNFGHNPSKWFGRFLREQGITEKHKEVFHSFRHTVATRLQNEYGIPPSIVGDVVGHESDGMTAGRYRATASIETLSEAIEKLSFPIAPLRQEKHE
ncbi:tyrosine-type recombinase/integrase [Marinobacter lacisalsi]|uniref:Tyrosine-type recombinase/integrase n=1 Tax=Marinobacter lacisalsi TaxID=475979 RepID=A0ABV8QDV1_9GAMM